MKTVYPTARAMFALRADSTPEPGQRRARGGNRQAGRSSRDGPVIKKEDDDDGVDADDEATVDGNATVNDDETIDENATEVEDESDDEEEYETPGTPTRGPRGPSNTAGNPVTPTQGSPSPEPESPVLKPALPVRRRLFPPSANRGNSGPPLPPGRRSVSEGLNNPFSLHGSPVSQGSWWRQRHTQGLGNLAAIQEHPERETGSFVRYPNPVLKSPLLHNSKTAKLKGGDKESPAAIPKADEADKTPAGYIRAPQKPEGKHMEFLRLNKDILAGKTSGPLQIPGKKEPVLPATTAPPTKPSLADPSHGYNPRATFDKQAKGGLRQPHGHLATSTSAPVYQPYQPNLAFGHSTNHNPVTGPSTFGFPLFSDTSSFPSANPARISYSTTDNMASLPGSNTYPSSEQSVSDWSPEAKRQEQEQKLPQHQQQPLVSDPAPTASSFPQGPISDSMIDPSLFSEATHQPQKSGQQGQPQQQADPQQQQSVFHAPSGLPGSANLNVGAGFNISNLVHNHNFLPVIPNIANSGASGINDDVARQALENAQSVEYQLLGLKIMSVAQGNSSGFAESSATHTSMDNASRRPQIGDQNNNHMNYESDQMEELDSEPEYPAMSSLSQNINPSIQNAEGAENNHNINNTGMTLIENDDADEEQANNADPESDSGSDSDSDPIPHMPDVATAEMHNPLFNAAADYWLDTPEHWARGANGLGLGPNHALPRPTQINPFSVTAPPLPRFETDPYMPFAPWRVRQLPPFHDEPTNRVLTIRARYLAPLGQLYPDAEFIVSRHPASKNFTARIKGRVLTDSMAVHFPGLVRASPHVGGYASILGADNDDEDNEENDQLYLVALAQRDWPIGGVAYLPHERRAKEFIEIVEQTFDVLPHGQEVFYFLPHRTVLAGGDDDSDEDGRNSKTKSSTITTSIGRSRSSRRNKRAKKNNTNKKNTKAHIPDNTNLAKGIWVCRAYEGRQGPQHPQIITDWLQIQGGVVEQDAPGRKMLVHMGEAELEQATWSHGKRRVLAPVVPVAAAPAAAAGRGKGKWKGKGKAKRG